MSRLFGTDGVRGIAGTELTAELAMKIGASLAHILNRNIKNPQVIIGSDTRESKDMLISGLCAGLCSRGVDVINIGIVPTPAIAYLVKKCQANAGIMVTASHNPYEYNGIKIFDSNGYKLDDNLEDEIQELITKLDNISTNKKIGKINYDNTAVNTYISHLQSVKSEDFSNLKVVIDCSNGSSSVTAPKLFESFGCKVKLINYEYNGTNINDNCGSTHIEKLKQYVTDNKYDLGFAFDGDADRCLAVDNEGNIIDGDYILAITSKYLQEKNKLKNNTVVGTIMSNLGFIKFCKENAINFISTKVGDRYVLEEMKINNYNLGGEQSGHIIFSDYSTTGDGQLTAIEIMNVLVNSNKSLKELSSIMKKYPQVLVNTYVSNDRKNEFYTNDKISKEIDKITKLLNGDGRVVVRPSGTEPLIRVMIEGKNEEEITNYANDLANFIKNILN